MAPAIVPTLMMLTTAAFTAKNYDSCSSMPPELVGVWAGSDKWVDDDNSIGVCEPAFAAYKEGASCSYSWLEACGDDGEFSIEDSYLYSVTSYKCTGFGQGFAYDVENTTGKHSCNFFKRTRDSLTYVYGNPVDTMEEVVCPDPEGVIGESSTISGVFTGGLSDKDDSADPADFACQ